MKNNLFAMVLLASSAALVPSFATGGERAQQSAVEVKHGPVPYTISPSRMRISGSVMAALNSADSQQYIGCVTSGNAGTWSIGYCYARTVGGRPMMCSTSDAGLIAVMAAISTSSFLAIDYEPTTGNCKKIEIHNDSRFLAPIADTSPNLPPPGELSPGRVTP